jgi:hypothetical protein
MVMVFFREPWYLLRNKYRLSYEVPEFQILESEFQFSDSSDIGIQKKHPTGILGIKNKIRILLTMEVPEIGTKNQNSQPRGTALPGSLQHDCNTLAGPASNWDTRPAAGDSP